MRNVEYHDITGISREGFWSSVANKINGQFNTTYTGYQCKEKFHSLIKDYNSMCQYMVGSSSGKRSRTGERYFEEFRTCFWERPVAVNLASQRDRSASLTQRIPTRRDETTNQDNVSNVNDADRNLGHNTNDVARNLDNAIYSSLTNLANTTSTPNISASQNDSDISMADIGGSQPLEPINEVES
ncbi:gag-pol fusion protein [Gigaspora margarita]|uniref:Gag-pol fusion protein n=1 Tax=Gigaspora margarita TaxID=4874 RepID=A0A8H4EPJ3_GIGMA|nr:gag-pol fusion protein [Gigaspora margarita]